MVRMRSGVQIPKVAPRKNMNTVLKYILVIGGFALFAFLFTLLAQFISKVFMDTFDVVEAWIKRHF